MFLILPVAILHIIDLISFATLNVDLIIVSIMLLFILYWISLEIWPAFYWWVLLWDSSESVLGLSPGKWLIVLICFLFLNPAFQIVLWILVDISWFYHVHAAVTWAMCNVSEGIQIQGIILIGIWLVLLVDVNETLGSKLALDWILRRPTELTTARFAFKYGSEGYFWFHLKFNLLITN